MMSNLRIVSTLLLGLGLCSISDAKGPSSLEPFLRQHCYACHNADVHKADLDLAGLEFDPSADGNLEIWQRVLERVRDREMPPKKRPQPNKAEAERFLRELEEPLLAADLADSLKNGRVQSRRLTRIEYEHTLHDLLGIDIPLKNRLPEDPASFGFETVAAGQQLSHYQLARYLDVADIALDEAFQRALHGDVEFQRRCTPEVLYDGRRQGNFRGPEVRNGESISWPISVQFYGRMSKTAMPDDGWYRITLRDVRAINPGKEGSVWGTLRSGVCYSNAPMLFMIGLVEATEKPRDLVYEAWIQKDHILELKPNDGELKRAKTGANGGSVSYRGRDLEAEGHPGIAHRGIDIERIYPMADESGVRRKLFGDQSPEEIAANPASSLTTLISDFASRAFRRPVSEAQLAPYWEIGRRSLAEGESVFEALRDSYRAMLCSPRFLTFIEAPGELDEHAVASRLSYALWVSMPDNELMQLADEKSLRQPSVLARQVERMLADPKSNRFIHSFTDQWLKLNQIDFTSPDQRQFRNFDPVVQESIVLETRAFIDELIRKNLGVEHLIDSDFAFLNGRLARHYRTEASVVPGGGLQKVSLSKSPQEVRGGLVTQASILKVTADGTSTSPVVRGVFVNERILGQQIMPPPPGVPAIEPDIRGATSIRDQLDKHRSDPSCASCHVTIDPPGFALESFDPVGGWRTRYGIGSNGVEVNPSGITPEGQAFENLFAWKKIYRERDDQLAKGFAEQFITYATGAPIQFGDKGIVDEIVVRSKESNFGMRTIMQSVINSSIFLNK